MKYSQEHLDPDQTFKQKEEHAEEKGRHLDGLQQYNLEMLEMRSKGRDPYQWFLTEKQSAVTGRTLRAHIQTVSEWTEHMETYDRHPTCPTDNHVEEYIEWLQTRADDPNEDGTIENKLLRLSSVHKWFISEGTLPFEEEAGNPFETGLEKANLDPSDPKKPPRIELGELRQILRGVERWRDLLIMMLQLKLALRATATANVEIADIALNHPDIQREYPEIGTHSGIEEPEYDDAIYIPSTDERTGNKSKVYRRMPLDDELRHVIIEYLRVRPDVDSPHLLLSEGFQPMDRESINHAWQRWFPEKYQKETEDRTNISSKFGRHFFTTFWDRQGSVDARDLLYMRGDVNKQDDDAGSDAKENYIHRYYEDIEAPYRENIYKLLF